MVGLSKFSIQPPKKPLPYLGTHYMKSMKGIQMQYKNHSQLGTRNYNKLSTNLSHVVCYDYHENIKYRKNMFPTRSLHGFLSKPCMI